jgi:hypothetical protein
VTKQCHPSSGDGATYRRFLGGVGGMGLDTARLLAGEGAYVRR